MLLMNSESWVYSLITSLMCCTPVPKINLSRQSKIKNALMVRSVYDQCKKKRDFSIFDLFCTFKLEINHCFFVVVEKVIKHSETSLTGMIGDKEFKRLFVTNRSGILYIYSISSVT